MVSPPRSAEDVEGVVVEPLDGAGPPVVVSDHDDARREPGVTGAGHFVGEAEVD